MLSSVPLIRKLLNTCFFLALATSASAQFDFGILDELYPEDFFQPPTMSQLTLSPSGDKYVYAYSSEVKNTLYLVDIESGKKTQFVGESIKKDFINYVAWKDERQIIFQARHGNIFYLDLNSGKRTLIFDAERTLFFYFAIFWGNYTLPRVVSLLPNDPEHILVSAFSENGKRLVYKIPLSGGDPEKPEVFMKNARGINSWYADPNGDIRLGAKSDQNGVEFFFNPDESNKWIPLKKLFQDDAAIEADLLKRNFLNRRDYFAGFGFDSNTLYIASNKQHDTTALYRYDIQAGRAIEEIAHDPKYDFFDLSTAKPILWRSSKRKKLLGIPYNQEKPTVLWLDEHFKGIQNKIDELLPESSNILGNWNTAETKFIVYAIRSDKPLSFHLYDLQADSLTLLGTHNDALQEKELSPSLPISLTSRDGLPLHGYLTLAKSDSGRPAPLIALPHGGPWVRDEWGYDPAIQWLAYNGYSVLQINFRGSTGYGYEHYIASRQNFGLGIQNDISDAVDWAVKQGHAEADNLAIMGFSYGAYATMLALSSQPEKYRCGVAMSGIYDLIKESKNVKKNTNTGIAYEHFRKMIGREWRDKTALQRISPVYLAKQVQRPVLLVHGKIDQVALYEHAEDMLGALESAGKSSELITIENEGHGFDLPANQISAYGAAVDFLDKHLRK